MVIVKKERYKVIITKTGLVFCVCLVSTMFWVFAQGTIEPESVIGKFVNDFGVFVAGLIVVGPFILIDMVLNKYGFKTYVRKQVNGL